MVGVDDDDDWQEMPVVASSSAKDEAPHGYEGTPTSGYDSSSSQSSSSSSSSSTRRTKHKRKSSQRAAFAPSHRPPAGAAATTNATGKSLNVDDARGYDWRSKPAAAKHPDGGDDDDDSDAEDEDEQGKGYTQLRLDEDVEADELHAATEYLFGGGTSAPGGGPNAKDPHESAVGYSYQNESNATPLSQMMTTKALLSEAQKIAYVGLCSLEAKEIVRLLKRIPSSSKDLSEAIKSAEEWHLRVEARLFQHMDIDASEQKMIQSLAEHGVLATDLAPSLVTTQKIDNPDYDPQAADEEAERVAQAQAVEAVNEDIAQDEEPIVVPDSEGNGEVERNDAAAEDGLEGDDDDGDLGGSLHSQPKPPSPSATSRGQAQASEKGDLAATSEDDGDLGAQDEGATTPTPRSPRAASPSLPAGPARADPNTAAQLAAEEANVTAKAEESKVETHLGLTSQPQTVEPPPNALPGVTTQISTLDTHITLDLRWTVLCDLFLVLTADSVYDSRSRVLLERVAEQLGLTWMDVTKFEKRVTDALEIEEGVEKLKDKKAIARREREARNKKWAMVGLATVGGGLVIGLSAGLAAPLVGTGLAALLGGVGIGGTSTFLGSIGGAALITTTGASAGAALGGRGMARRTQSVRTFMFKPIHNNKRINCIVTMPGFMAGPQDDVRLPFGVIDSIMGDVFSVLWEPEMMQEMGNAMNILWNETLVMGVQQVLMTTIASGFLGALAWPLWLTKLGYFIDNPWSNACTRAQAAGKILADVLAKRQLGVRPITLVGFSLGARAIFYALCELAKKKAFGVVQNVYIFGTPVAASDKVWKEARSVVAGRFVNGFSRTDWILGYLFRATSGGLRSIAGLHPVERVPDVENVDVTTSVPGHLQYRAFMPLVLSEVGFRVTQDWFDEPEDLSKIPDRQVVLEENKQQQDPVKTQSAGGLPQAPPRSSSKDYEYDEGDDDAAASKDHDEDDDDDLPPREEHTHRDSRAAEEQDADSHDSAGSTHIDADAMLAELRETGIEVKELQSSLPALTIAQPASPAIASPSTPSAPTPTPAPASAPPPAAPASRPTSGFKASVASFFGSRKAASSSSSSASSSRPTTPTLPSAPSDAVTANRGATAGQKRPLYLSRDSSMTAGQGAAAAAATPPLPATTAKPPLSRRSSATPPLRVDGGSSGRQSPLPPSRAPFSYASASTTPSTPAGLPAESTVNLSFASDFDDGDDDEDDAQNEPRGEAAQQEQQSAPRNDFASSATSYGLSAEAAKELARQFGGGGSGSSTSTTGDAAADATQSRKSSVGGDWAGSAGWGDSTTAALPSPSAFSSGSGLASSLRPLETSYGALSRERSSSVSVGGGIDEVNPAYQGAAVRDRAPSSARAGGGAANSGLNLDENPWG